MNEQEKFSRSLDFTLKWEGGQNFRIVNSQLVMKDSAKNDSGGATAFGITALMLKAAHMAGIVAHDDITSLTLDEAKEIYRAFYWDKYNWGALSWPICLCCFDCCVNHGGFAYILQRAVNDCGQNVIIDGKLGAATFDALKSCEPKQLAKAIYHQRFAYFQKIITRDSRQSAFLKGWLRRNDDMAREAGVLA